MAESMPRSPIQEADIYLGTERQNLQRTDSSLYHAYTQGPDSLYIGQDVENLLAYPDVQQEITNTLHTSPNLIQIRVTPDQRLFVAKTDSDDFHEISFERAPPELIAIVDKTQAVYRAMRPLLQPQSHHTPPLTNDRNWSQGYPTSEQYPPHYTSSSDTTHLHERISSLENALAIERLRNDMHEMGQDIREIRDLLKQLLAAKERGVPVPESAIENLQERAQGVTVQLEALNKEAQRKGLEDSHEMEELQSQLKQLQSQLRSDGTPSALKEHQDAFDEFARQSDENIAKLKEALQEQQARAEKAEKLRLELGEELNSVREELRASGSKNEQLKTRKLELEESLNAATEKSARLEKKLDDVTQQLQVSEKGHLKAKKRVAVLHEEGQRQALVNSTLHSDFLEEKEKTEELQRDLTLEQEKSARLGQEKDHLKDQLANNEKLRLQLGEELNSVRKELHGSDLENKQLKARKLELKENLNTATKESVRLSEALQVSEKGRLEALEKADQHETTIQALQRDVQGERRTGQKLLLERDKGVKALEDLQSKLEEVTTQLEEEQSRVEETSADHKQLTDQIQTLKDHVAEREETLVDLQEKLRLSEKNLEQHQETLIEAEKDMAAQKAASEKWKQEAKTEGSLKQEAQEQNRNLQEQHQLLQQGRDKLQETHAALELENTALEQQLRKEKETVSELTEQVAELEKTQKAQELLLQSKLELIKDLEGQVEELEQRISPEDEQQLRSELQESERQVATLKESLSTLERSFEVALTPQGEKELREELRVAQEESSQFREKLELASSAEQEVVRLKLELQERGSLSELEIKELQNKLKEAKGTAKRATQNAIESEARFQTSDKRVKELKDQLLLITKLNQTLQSEADDAEGLRRVLSEVSKVVENMNGPSALPGIVKEKMGELEERNAILQTLWDQLVPEDSLAAQLGQVDYHSLPNTVAIQLRGLQQLEEVNAELAKKLEAAQLDAVALHKELEQQSGVFQQEFLLALQGKQDEIEQLYAERERLEQSHKAEVSDLQKQIREEQANVKERQDVVNESLLEMVALEEERNKAIKQRDAARATISEKSAEIEKLTQAIGSLNDENSKHYQDLQSSERLVKKLRAELQKEKEYTSQQTEELDIDIARIQKLEIENDAKRTRIEKNVREIAALKDEVGTLRAENRTLKESLEHIAAQLGVPFTLGEEPEQFLSNLEGRVKALNAENLQLQEAVSTDTQRRLNLEKEIAKRGVHIEELEGQNRLLAEKMHATETALTHVQQQIQRAQTVGQAFEELRVNLGEGAISLGALATDKAFLKVSKNHQEYLTLMATNEYGRHLPAIKANIAKINSAPGELTNLNLFIKFFGVTDHVSGITKSGELADLNRNRGIIRELRKWEGHESGIEELEAGNADLTRALLQNLMARISETTDKDSGLSRYKNFGIHLMIWDAVLNNLDEKYYVRQDQRNPMIRKYADAQKLRETVHQLNAEFHRLLMSTHTQDKQGVWVPNE